MATRLDPLEYLERSDKWYLAGGHAAMYAPAFPKFLDAFGYWDESYFVDIRLERLFTVLVLDEDERPFVHQLENRRWTPDALTQIRTSADGLRFREDRVITSRDTLASRITVHNDGKRARKLHFILWSLQNHQPIVAGQRAESAEETQQSGDYLHYAHTVSYGQTPFADRPAVNQGWGERGAPATERIHKLYIALGADKPPVSVCASLAEPADISPLWQVSVVPEKLRDGVLHGGILSSNRHGNASTIGVNPLHVPTTGHLHLCMHYTLEIPSGETRSIQFGANTGLDRARTLLFLQNDLQSDVAATSRSEWQKYFDSVPYFECSDPFLQKYYWYRWYGLRLLTVRLGGHQVEGEDGIRYGHPCVLEGIGAFRGHISYSAQCHALEASWMHDLSLAMGCIEGMFAAQEHSGYLPGHLYLWRETRGFYHANWGAAALQIYRISQDREFIDRLYPALSRYAEYFDRERDREDSHLYDVVDQGETGQEYMSRYLFADASADDWRKIQLKGVDATVYLHQLQVALAEFAGALGKTEEALIWLRKATETQNAVVAKMWHGERCLFLDVHPRTGERSPYLAATGFYPFLTDIATADHLSAIRDLLLNPDEFWAEYPAPATNRSDPYFSSEAEWKGRRMSCPWNGRVWPMVNSHLCSALSNAARSLDESLRPSAAEFISKFVKMMFFDGDVTRPNCFEHYNPVTGVPCVYRGIDDYQHSWVIQLLISDLVGLQPRSDNLLVIDPLPFDVTRYRIDGIKYRGHDIGVHWDNKSGLEVIVDGAVVARSPQRTRIEIPLVIP